MEAELTAYHPPARDGGGVLASLGLRTAATSEMIAAVKRGLPAGAFAALAAKLGVSEAALAGVTGISASTLLRRKRAGRLSSEESEHVLRVARLLDIAARLFGSADDAAAWMRDENPALGGASPLVFADTEVGAREVEDLLGRLELGVYS